MLCQRCKKNEATTHLKQNINGNISEFHLCNECAMEEGFGEIINPFSFNFSDMLSSVFSNLALENKVHRCPSCGAAFADIVEAGKLGCSECYSVFYDELMPTLQRIHGRTQHIGKISLAQGEETLKKNKLKALKQELKEAVASERYEDAAKLRDQIKDIEEA